SMMVNPATEAVVASYSYAPYGAQLTETGPDAALNPFRAKGYWTDAAAPDIAWAQPATNYGIPRVVKLAGGVWLQRDASGENGGFNLNEYLENDPINNSDPNGTTAQDLKEHISWLPKEVQSHVIGVIELQYDGQLPNNPALTAEDEPYRAAIAEAYAQLQKPFDVEALYNSLKRA